MKEHFMNTKRFLFSAILTTIYGIAVIITTGTTQSVPYIIVGGMLGFLVIKLFDIRKEKEEKNKQDVRN